MGNFASTDYILAGAQDRSITFALQSRVNPITNLRYSYSRKNEGSTYDAAVAGACTALGSLGAAHTDGGAYYLSATATDPGYFLIRVDFPDAAFATGRDKVLCSVYDDATGVIAHRIFTLKGDDSIYDDSAVWLNDLTGSNGNVPYVNGIPGKPCTNLGDALAVANAIGLKKFRLCNRGSTVFDIATTSYSGFTFVSDDLVRITLGSVSQTNLCLIGIDVTNNSGMSVGSNWFTLINCRIGHVAGMDIPRAIARTCVLTGIVHLSNNGNYFFHGLKTEGGVTLDFKNQVGGDPGITSVFISGFSGRLTIKNMLTTDSLEISGEGEVIFDSTCNSATATARVNGAIKITNNATALALTDNTAGRIPTLKKNTPVAKYKFVMIDATTGNPATGKTVSATVSLDNGAFTAMANSVTERAFGVYEIDIAAADVNGNTGAFRFTATGCEDTIITFITES